ncbi:hypothetical protein CPT_Sonora_036 [Stenotrophomonas phage Sonora]|nr:hypothetical protein CPT_Sonora_036 [Stenotrophomonas phage Sonora]
MALLFWCMAESWPASAGSPSPEWPAATPWILHRWKGLWLLCSSVGRPRPISLRRGLCRRPPLTAPYES